MGGGGACTEALVPERVKTMSRMTARRAPDAHAMCFGFRTESIFICYFSWSRKRGLRNFLFPRLPHWGIDWLISGNLNGRVSRSDFGNSGKNSLPRTRCANNFLEHRGLVDLRAKGNVFLLKFLLGSLAILDVCTRNIPTHELSLFIARSTEANQKAAKTSITFPYPHLQ